MNESDSTRTLQKFKDIAALHPDAAVMAFDSSLLTSKLRNTKASSFLNELNDLLSHSTVCKELGTVYTVCEYEGSVWLMIRANKVVSITSRFDASRLTFTQ